MGFGQVIEELRLDRGLSQKELGLQINRSGGTICNYENNKYFPDIETLVTLADFFGTATDFILERTKFKYTMEQLNMSLGNDITVGDILNTLIEMTPEDRSHLIYYFKAIKPATAGTSDKVKEK